MPEFCVAGAGISIPGNLENASMRKNLTGQMTGEKYRIDAICPYLALALTCTQLRYTDQGLYI
jgi:hypothetical protein